MQAIGEYSADAMRWALADAGDGMDDANFETTTANAAILRLTKELAWMEEQLSPTAGRRCNMGQPAVIGYHLLLCCVWFMLLSRCGLVAFAAH